MTNRRTLTRQEQPVCCETSNKAGLKQRVSAPKLYTLNNSQQAASAHLNLVQESEPIPIQGLLTLQAWRPDITYRVDFSQSLIARLAASQPNLTGIESPYTENIRRNSLRGVRFSPKENRQLIGLKESKKLTWDVIVRHFPGRNKRSLQAHYAKPRSGWRTEKNKGTGGSEGWDFGQLVYG